jgi:hypothetical protein
MVMSPAAVTIRSPGVSVGVQIDVRQLDGTSGIGQGQAAVADGSVHGQVTGTLRE